MKNLNIRLKIPDDNQLFTIITINEDGETTEHSIDECQTSKTQITVASERKRILNSKRLKKARKETPKKCTRCAKLKLRYNFKNKYTSICLKCQKKIKDNIGRKRLKRRREVNTTNEFLKSANSEDYHKAWSEIKKYITENNRWCVTVRELKKNIENCQPSLIIKWAIDKNLCTSTKDIINLDVYWSFEEIKEDE